MDVHFFAKASERCLRTQLKHGNCLAMDVHFLTNTNHQRWRCLLSQLKHGLIVRIGMFHTLWIHVWGINRALIVSEESGCSTWSCTFFSFRLPGFQRKVHPNCWGTLGVHFHCSIKVVVQTVAGHNGGSPKLLTNHWRWTKPSAIFAFLFTAGCCNHQYRSPQDVARPQEGQIIEVRIVPAMEDVLHSISK